MIDLPAEFQIQGYWSHKLHRQIPPMTIPWNMIAPHCVQAMRNHGGQNLLKLNSRGGLSHHEAIAVMEGTPTGDAFRMTDGEAEEYLKKMVADYEAGK